MDLAGLEPTPAATGPVIVQRKVSDRGTTQVAGQKLQVGFAHRNTLVDVHVADREFQIYDNTAAPRPFALVDSVHPAMLPNRYLQDQGAA